MASRAFKIAVKFGQVDLTVWHLREVAEVSAACLCMILQLQGLTGEACRELEESLERHPCSARLVRHGIELYIKSDQAEKAIGLVEKQASAEENRQALADAVRGACRAAKKDWLAALGYLQGAYLAGCRHPLCLRWLTVTLLSNGEIEAARPVLEEWRQSEPNHPEMLAYSAALSGDAQPPKTEIVSETPSQAPDSRQYRLDLGITTSECLPLGLPFLHQVTSFDTMLPTE